MKHSSDALLDQAIELAETGRSTEALAAFTQLVEQDEENEIAWQYLYQLVDNDDDRRVCLENLLTLNPDNKEAVEALAELDRAREIRVQPLNYQQTSDYDDIWSDENATLCGFCAHQLNGDDNVCPNCQNNLLGWIYRYEKPSNALSLYQIVLGTLGFFLLVEAAILIARAENVLFTAHQILFGLVTMGLAIGIGWRRNWLNVVAIADLLYLLAVRILVGVVFRVDGITLDWIIDRAVRLNNLADWAQALTTVAQLLLILISLVLGVGVVPADFDRRYYRHIAKVGKGRKDAAGYYTTGRSYAKKGQWATAVRYWQRATAAAPAQISYHKALGEGYGQLGFYERSLDTLRWARQNSYDEVQQEELDQLIKRFGQYQLEQGKSFS